MPRTGTLAVAMVGLLIALATASCGGDSSPSADATRAPGGSGGSGALIYTQPDGIYERVIDSGDTRQLLAATDASEFLLDPTVAPAGDRVAYIRQPPPV